MIQFAPDHLEIERRVEALLFAAAGPLSAAEIALFTLLGEFPIAAVTSVVVIVLVGVFFVSGADAASIVMGMLSCRGALDLPRLVVALWGTLMGAVAIVLLLSGGLASLQQAAIIVGAPFTRVLLGLAVSLHRALRAERPPGRELQPSVAVPEPGPAVTEPGRAGGS